MAVNILYTETLWNAAIVVDIGHLYCGGRGYSADVSVPFHGRMNRHFREIVKRSETSEEIGDIVPQATVHTLFAGHCEDPS